ncbi:hypothetical protein CJJ23_04565 [Mycoplasmopsis agassizii]|uniref:DUF31 domain-containing protein n=1 Tax=Mycoplasmopsis agassizii TaxID=33922 RepID=A0A269THL9_9BACT|nr:hypothetical protein [Mycoplasmopsis agassizii]PAK20934.1 hypothetical protein CJJ23_04565 [Mycoplasmopsis agassizii]
MKFKKKNLIWSFALSTFAISAATLIACSQQETPTPNPTPTPPTESDPGQPPATDPGKGAGNPGSDNPGGRGATDPIDPNREKIENEPGLDDLPKLSDILNDPKYKRTRTHTSNLAALDTDITVTRYANYNGNGVQNTANNNPFVEYGTDAYNIIKNDHYETLEDYSLRVSITNPDKKAKDGGPLSVIGSAWILDFIKKDGEAYPLTWFFGSNLHVFKEMRLPIKADGTYSTTPGHTFSFLLPKDEQWKEFAEYKTLTNYPELFFSGQNFLGDRISINEQVGAPDYLRKDIMNYNSFKDYAKDFAVVKVKFKDEAEAKAITRNFATKYTTPKIKFDKKSILEKSGDEIARETKIFALGYPGTSSKPTINKRDNDVNPNTGSSYSSLISGYMITNNYGEKIPGVYDTMYINGAGNSVAQYTEEKDGKIQEIEWQGKKAHFPLSIEIGNIDYDRFGLGIGIDNNNLPPGASGSLIIDNDYKVVGVQWGYDGTSQTGLIDPLVSSELKNPDGTKVFYDYDLIHGRGSDQTRSYKSLLTELLKKDEYKQKNAKSWLLGNEIQTS